MNLRRELEGSSNSDRMLPLLAVACPNLNINQVHHSTSNRLRAQIMACMCLVNNTWSNE